MNGSGRDRGSWPIVVTIGVILQVGGSVSASPLAFNETFTTSGNVGTSGVSGAPVVTFQGITDGGLTTGSSFNLGQFVVSGTPSTSPTTYSVTPFQITLQILGNGTDTPPTGGYASVTLAGFIDGTVNGTDLSGLQIYNDKILVSSIGGSTGSNPTNLTIPTFRTGSLTNFLVVSDGGASSPLSAVLNVTQAVPEPGSVVVFACLIGLIVRHRVRREGGMGRSKRKVLH